MEQMVHRYLKHNIHICDDWSRPIYYINNGVQKTWLCDTSCGDSNIPQLYFINRGKSYNYDGEPDYLIENFKIVN
ncbi:MAG: hypothetical protein K2P99_07640 [Burkholderiales bacterium]|nr:hypothetical protein [Burkholderiales bacterium]